MKTKAAAAAAAAITNYLFGVPELLRFFTEKRIFLSDSFNWLNFFFYDITKLTQAKLREARFERDTTFQNSM